MPLWFVGVMAQESGKRTYGVKGSAQQPRLRVAIVCHAFSATRGGGMERALFTLASELRKHCALTVISPIAQRTGELDGIDWIRLPVIPCMHFLLQYSTFRAAWNRYRRGARAGQRFDVLYASSPLFEGADFASVHFNSTRYLQIMRGPERPGRQPLASLKHKYHRVMHAVASRHERSVYAAIASGRSATVLLPVSDALADTLVEDFHLTRDAMRVVPNPLDLERFQPGVEDALRKEICSAAGWPEDAFLLLFVGGAWQRKGLDAALQALSGTDAAVKLVVVGSGDAAAYRINARHLGVADRLWFAGVRTDVERFYRIADVFVLPSVFEALPLACAEALASGLPAIVYPFPGSASLIVPNENGFIVDSPERIAKAVMALRADPDRRRGALCSSSR